MSKHINAIGDIHGRTVWEKLVREDCRNILMGDYFSPYHRTDEYSFENQKRNFLNIIQFKKDHPDTVLLIGNHDADHWRWSGEVCTRHDFKNESVICDLFNENADMFTAAHCEHTSSGDCLFTHAGVAMPWLWHQCIQRKRAYAFYIDCNDEDMWEMSAEDALKKYLYDTHQVNDTFIADEHLMLHRNIWYVIKDGTPVAIDMTAEGVAMEINRLWNDDPDAFSYDRCAISRYDDCENGFHSPMWIRMYGIAECNAFKGSPVTQIFAHTMCSDITEHTSSLWDGHQWIESDNIGRCVMIDCLEYTPKSLVI